MGFVFRPENSDDISADGVKGVNNNACATIKIMQAAIDIDILNIIMPSGHPAISCYCETKEIHINILLKTLHHIVLFCKSWL